jgi:hypothetical protein
MVSGSVSALKISIAYLPICLPVPAHLSLSHAIDPDLSAVGLRSNNECEIFIHAPSFIAD